MSAKPPRVERAPGTPRAIRSGMKPYVYFIQSDTDGPIKIGYARDVYLRLNNLQAAHYVQLNYLGDFPGGRAEERELHDEFAHLRIRGEWFAPAPELLERIETLTAIGRAHLEQAVINASLGTALHPGVVDASPAHDAGPHHH